MPSFHYESLTSTGEARQGILDAVDRAEAVRILTGRGEVATSLNGDGAAPAAAPRQSRAARNGTSAKPAATPSPAAPAASATQWLKRLRRARPTLGRADVATLIREVATAVEAGLPLMQSLRTVRRQAHGKAMPVILDYLIERVEAGDPLHSAARDYGPPFDDMIVGMLRAADASGRMAEILHQLADLLERSVELRREVTGATIYPMIIALLIVASMIVFVTVLVPRLIEPLAAEMNDMPWPTEVLMASAAFFSSYWIFCVLGVLVICFGWRAWSRIPANRFKIDRFKLRIPVVGRLLRDVAVARFTRTLGTLTSSGLPILDALRITRQTLGNTAMMAAIEEVQDQVSAGKSLAAPLERSGLFPPLLVQVVNLGERSGRLESMLLHAASAFDRQVNASLKLFSKAFPPVLLIIMAAVVAFVLAAILLPLLNMSSMVA